jgi:hypothetical protein
VTFNVTDKINIIRLSNSTNSIHHDIYQDMWDEGEGDSEFESNHTLSFVKGKEADSDGC